MPDIPARKPSKKSVLIWTAATVGAALIGAIVRDYWEAANPVVELQSISIAAAGGSDQLVLEPSLAVTIERHPYYLLDTNKELSVEDIRTAIRRNQKKDREFGAVSDTSEKLRKYLKATSPQLDIEIRRRDFFRIWSDGDIGSVMERLAKAVLATFEKNLPPKYQDHPEGAASLYVTIGAGHSFNLSEIDEEAMAQQEAQARGPVGVYARVLLDAHRTNLLRRLWLYLEHEVLISFLDELDSYAKSLVESSGEIAEQLEHYTAPTGPRHLSARVMVANTGRRALPIGPQGVLYLHLPAQTASQIDQIVPANVHLSPAGVASLVGGGEARILEYTTLDNLDEVFGEVESTDVAGFRRLYDEGAIRARITLSRAGSDDAQLAIGPSELRPIGPKSINKRYEIIRNLDDLYIKSLHGTR